MTDSSSLTRAHARRRALNDAMTQLEKALAGPAAAEGWLDRVEDSLAGLREGLEAHVAEVEGPRGLLAEIVDVAPRLAAATRELEDEHGLLLAACDRAERKLEAIRGSVTPDGVALRRRLTTLLGRVTLHRQRGADLVYEAYNVDIAAAD
ncbi:MAG: hypothetical protein ACRDZM_14165 [Acidimicrobiia bacterium]